jgi:hypothetical protein
MRQRAITPALVVLVVVAASARAQWLTVPTPGIPRTADGRPDLNAPAPRTADGKPDLSGIWQTPTGRYLRNLAADGVEVRMHPWAEKLYKERLANEGRDRPSASCLPHSVTDFTSHATPRRVIQVPGLVVFLFEAYHTFRQIHTDGRPLPIDPEPAWDGYSVGRWDGDTLVVETIGINEKSWLDDSGHPHSDALRVTERFRRPTFGRIDVAITIDDPKAYLKPWTANFHWEYMPDTELLGWACLNNKYFDLVPNAVPPNR